MRSADNDPLWRFAPSLPSGREGEEGLAESIKGFSARAINRSLGRKGALWLDESFDHIIRHEEELNEKIAYIRDNPVKRRLVASWKEYRWLWIRSDSLERLSHQVDQE